MPKAAAMEFSIRNVELRDIKEVYRLLSVNRPYVGLNSRYTYFLLAKDFQQTCAVALHDERIVAFSSGYIPPARADTFFSWEVVVDKDFRGYGLHKKLALYHLKTTGAKYFEGTVNPSNEVAKKNFLALAQQLKAKHQESVLFSEEDFENDGHEAEILYRIGPISAENLEVCHAEQAFIHFV